MQRAKHQAPKNSPRPKPTRDCSGAPKPLAWVAFVSCLLLACCGTGCSTLQGVRNYIAYNDTQNDFVIGWRNRVWSIQAWHMEREKYLAHPYLHEFGDGFRTGFRDVAAGGNGCPPVVPPRKYWSWRYQSPEGQAKVAAWFEGYPIGAMVAERNQAGEFSDIQVSYSIEAQYSPRFRSGELPGLPAPTYSPEALPLPQPTNLSPTAPSNPNDPRLEVESTVNPSTLLPPLETSLPLNTPLGTGLAQPEPTNRSPVPAGVGPLQPLPVNPTSTLPASPNRRSPDHSQTLAEPTVGPAGLDPQGNPNMDNAGQPTTGSPNSTILGTPVPNPPAQTMQRDDSPNGDHSTLNPPATGASPPAPLREASISQAMRKPHMPFGQPGYNQRNVAEKRVTLTLGSTTTPNQLTYAWPDDFTAPTEAPFSPLPP